jgi:hypothetical protein
MSTSSRRSSTEDWSAVPGAADLPSVLPAVAGESVGVGGVDLHSTVSVLTGHQACEDTLGEVMIGVES